MNRCALALLMVALAFDLAANAADPPLKALIVDGQSNHEMWPKTSFMMKRYLG